MEVLVTGPDGVLGSNLVRELLSRDYNVSVLLEPGKKKRHACLYVQVATLKYLLCAINISLPHDFLHPIFLYLAIFST
jgi:nucleoside-diphosphate-sugar epimerase